MQHVPWRWTGAGESWWRQVSVNVCQPSPAQPHQPRLTGDRVWPKVTRPQVSTLRWPPLHHPGASTQHTSWQRGVLKWQPLAFCLILADKWLGNIQVLCHQEVLPTGLGKYDTWWCQCWDRGGWLSKIWHDDGILWQCFAPPTQPSGPGSEIAYYRQTHLAW